MLLERLYYADDFPMNITIAHIDEDPLHYHLDIEILYVLHGTLRLKNGYCHYELHEGDIFTNSGHEVHSIASDDPDCVVAQFQLSTHYFSQYFPDLSKACYRTYSKKPSDKKHDRLRELLLQILMKYTAKGFRWKNECLYLMADTIRHLDKYFNLFAFDKDMVVGFDKGNPVAVERISRICQYIYQYYADNITLEDLSQMEHLNSFYLSHLIKGFTGMSFREFLCFARVEWSEIPLLDSDAKISRIAREVGFSTTAYYKKYFEKWFRMTPEAHRALYRPQIKSDLRPAVVQPLSRTRSEALIKRAYANYHLKKGDRSVLSSVQLEVNVPAAAPSMGQFCKKLAVSLTLADYQTLGMALLPPLLELAPAQVQLLEREQDDRRELEKLARLLRQMSLPVVRCPAGEGAPTVSAARDSILYPLYLTGKWLRTAEDTLTIRLREDNGPPLQGQDTLLTCQGIRKPVYAFCQALSHVRGDILRLGNQYAVLRREQNGTPTFYAVVCNAPETAEALCRQPSEPRQVRSLLNDFQDEISVHIGFQLPAGRYTVQKYTLSRWENLFAYLSHLDFPPQLPGGCPELYSAVPRLEVYPDDVRTVLDLTCTIRGAGLQLAVIRPAGAV